jgi:transcriptional regulator with GAF, ATPase, and Fis domain
MDVFKEYIENRCGKTEIVAGPAEGETVFGVLDTLPTLKESGRLLVHEALRRAQNNQAIAAQMLGITRQALNWRLKQEAGKSDAAS